MQDVCAGVYIHACLPVGSQDGEVDDSAAHVSWQRYVWTLTQQLPAPSGNGTNSSSTSMITRSALLYATELWEEGPEGRPVSVTLTAPVKYGQSCSANL